MKITFSMIARMIVLLHIYNLSLSFLHSHINTHADTRGLKHTCEPNKSTSLDCQMCFVHSHYKRHVGNDSNTAKKKKKKNRLLAPEICSATTITVRANHPCNHSAVCLE